MKLVMNLQNEDMHWFSGKRAFIHDDVYMRFNGGVGSRVTSLFSCGFALSCEHQMLLLVSVVSKYSRDQKIEHI